LNAINGEGWKGIVVIVMTEDEPATIVLFQKPRMKGEGLWGLLIKALVHDRKRLLPAYWLEEFG
jgi:hypothetical protein